MNLDYKQVRHKIYQRKSSFNNFFTKWALCADSIYYPPCPSVGAILKLLLPEAKKICSKVLTPFLDSDDTIFKNIQFLFSFFFSFKALNPINQSKFTPKLNCAFAVIVHLELPSKFYCYTIFFKVLEALIPINQSKFTHKS